MYPHRQMGGVPPGSSARLNELLEQIRAEFDTQIRQTEGFEHQSKSSYYSYDHPYLAYEPRSLTHAIVSAQVSEMQLVREKVYAMEQTHMTLKQK